MSFVVRGVDFPDKCLGCPFLGEVQKIRVLELEKVSEKHPRVYEEIARCMFHPEGIEDPWREVSWFYEHKEEWCPIDNLGKHGRLIDADELLTHVVPENPEAQFHCVAVRHIENAPTIIEAEGQE